MCHNAVEALRNEDLMLIRKYQHKIDEWFKLYEIYPTFNQIMKWAMKEMGSHLKLKSW